jgi:uncharacterized caspase-like protein
MLFTQGHALLIGVGTYQYERQINVPVTAADAQAVADVLRDPAYCGYPDAQVKPLRNAAASREGILDALDTLATRTGEGDTVFLFFCGHGDYGDDGNYYLTTHDTRLRDRKVVSGSGVRQSEFIEKLRAIKAKRLLLVINACHSGELAPTLGESEAPYTGIPLPAQTAAALLSTGEGRIIITACREQQKSYVGSGSLTLFTQALVDGLRGHGTSSNRGYLSAFDLYTHLYFTVEETVRQKYVAKQEPELTVLKGVGPFAVSLYRAATTLGDFDGLGRAPEGMAVREVRPDYAQRMLQQITVVGTVAGPISQAARDIVNAQGSQGFINHPTGPVTQHFGDRVDTKGGAYVRGPVRIQGGDSTGRDRLVHGDEIDEDNGLGGPELQKLFEPLAIVIDLMPPDVRAKARRRAEDLKSEIAKGNKADDARMAKLINRLVGLEPAAMSAVTNMFAMPILAGLAGNATKLALEKIKRE